MRTVVKTITTTYINERALLTLGKYGDGTPAIQLTSLNGEPLAKATVNLSSYGITPAPGNIIIKNSDENEGMTEALLKAGIITEIINTYSYGCVKDGAQECRLSDEMMSLVYAEDS